MKKKRLTDDELIELLIDKQFEIAGHSMTYKELYELGLNEEQDSYDDNWYIKYTITEEQEREYEEWFVNTVSDLRRISKKAARKEFIWFSLAYGLKTIRKVKDSLPE